jgi:hypothetical protein
MIGSMDAFRPGDLAALAPAQQRLATQARLLRGLSVISQIVLMAALLVMWKQFKMPFSRAFERCFACGVIAYFVLGIAASVLLTIARLHPVHMLLRQFIGIVSLLIFAALHYVYGMEILKSAAAWFVIYIAAWILVRQIKRQANQRLSLI